jgi:hypothetical protein
MNGLGRRQRKKKPIFAKINPWEFHHGIKESAIGFRTLAIEEKVRSRDHCGSILTSHEMNSLNNALLFEYIGLPTKDPK